MSKEESAGDNRNRAFYRRLGARLSLVRRLNGHSQETSGAEIGVCYQQMQKYEKGTARIPIDKLIKLAGFYDVPLQFLADPDIERDDIGEFDKLAIEMLACLKDLPTDDARRTCIVHARYLHSVLSLRPDDPILPLVFPTNV